jgi:mannose-6-phosphate isomerase-like protein (cupin superfamily)
MRVYKKEKKSIPGFGYWGDFGEIDTGWSCGQVVDNSRFPGEKLHYHKKGTTYFLGIDGTGVIEVEGKEIELSKDALLRIDPGEKYRTLRAKKTPFKWIVVCTSKDRSEKVVVE